MWIFWTLLLLFSVEFQQCARILGFFPITSRSHYSITRKIMTTLASRGHQVTVISGVEEKEIIENYTHIHLTEPYYNAVDSLNVNDGEKTEIRKLMNLVDEFEPDRYSSILTQDRVKEVILSKSNEYDLVFLESYYYPGSLALGSYLNAPVIWFIAPNSHYPIDFFTGNPNNPAYVPSIISDLSSDMSFIDRLMNLYQISVIHYYQANVFVPAAVHQFNKLYNAQVTLDQVYQLPNFAFTYGHYTLLPRPNLPNVVEIGGAHIEEEKPLPKDIKDFIEKAEHGAIFFSFGTSLKCSSISEEKMKMFKEVFSKIPQRVLWRCDIADQVKVPDNVMIRYWFPQRDILAHSNVRAFVSHGGLLGTYEAIYTGTAVIGIPFLFDQRVDIRLLEKHGAAIRLNYEQLTADVLSKSIDEVVTNFKYNENMEKLSAIFKDQPMTPMDTVTYWTEYVINHRGAVHLKSPAASLPLYQYLLFDIISVLVIGIVLTLCVTTISIYKLSALVCYYYNLLKYSKKKSS